jgi:hypothetical protein
LGLQKGGRLLIGNLLLVPIVMISQLESGISSQIIFITLFFRKCWALLCLSPASAANCAKMLGQNHFAKPNWHVSTALPFTSLYSNLCKKCWAKTILLSQSDMFWLCFIQIYCAGSRTEHCRGRSYVLLLKGQSHCVTIRLLLFLTDYCSLSELNFRCFPVLVHWYSCGEEFLMNRVLYESWAGHFFMCLPSTFTAFVQGLDALLPVRLELQGTVVVRAIKSIFI